MMYAVLVHRQIHEKNLVCCVFVYVLVSVFMLPFKVQRDILTEKLQLECVAHIKLVVRRNKKEKNTNSTYTIYAEEAKSCQNVSCVSKTLICWSPPSTYTRNQIRP